MKIISPGGLFYRYLKMDIAEGPVAERSEYFLFTDDLVCPDSHSDFI